jgi:hypothetical protein
MLAFTMNFIQSWMNLVSLGGTKRSGKKDFDF